MQLPPCLSCPLCHRSRATFHDIPLCAACPRAVPVLEEEWPPSHLPAMSPGPPSASPLSQLSAQLGETSTTADDIAGTVLGREGSHVLGLLCAGTSLRKARGSLCKGAGTFSCRFQWRSLLKGKVLEVPGAPWVLPSLLARFLAPQGLQEAFGLCCRPRGSPLSSGWFPCGFLKCFPCFRPLWAPLLILPTEAPFHFLPATPISCSLSFVFVIPYPGLRSPAVSFRLCTSGIEGPSSPSSTEITMGLGASEATDPYVSTVTSW